MGEDQGEGGADELGLEEDFAEDEVWELEQKRYLLPLTICTLFDFTSSPKLFTLESADVVNSNCCTSQKSLLK
jgi:hypothetical protein